MNILRHEKIKNIEFDNHIEPLQILWSDIESKYRSIRSEAEKEIIEIFSDTKIRPILITFLHSVAVLKSPMGRLSTSLKSTFAIDFEVPDTEVSSDIPVLEHLNEFIHNR